MFSKILFLSASIICSLPVLAADSNTPFLDRKDSYNGRRKANFRQFMADARQNGPIHDTVEELPEEIFSYLAHSKTGEFDKGNHAAVFHLMYYTTHGNFSKNFSVEELGGGFVSGKIYKVTDEDANRSYFIKYLRKRTLLVPKGRILGEQVNLESIKENDHLKKYCWRGSILSPMDLPYPSSDDEDDASSVLPANLKIVLPLKVFNYKFNDKDKIFMILPGAKGKSLASIVEDSLTPKSSPNTSPSSSPKKKKDNSSHNVDQVCEAFSKVGSIMGQWHAKHNTYKGQLNHTDFDKEYFANLGVFAHGDFHSHNIFVSEDGISLIDAETVANSFGAHKSPNAPIYYDFFYLMLMTEKHFPGAMESMEWRPLKALFQSYIEAYPQEQQDGLCSYFYYHLKHIKKFNFTDIFENFTWKKDYSKTTVKGATNIASHLVEFSLEELRKEALERYGSPNKDDRDTPKLLRRKHQVFDRDYFKALSYTSASSSSSASPSTQSEPMDTDVAPIPAPSLSLESSIATSSDLLMTSKEVRQTIRHVRPVGGRIAKLIEQHNRMIEAAQPKTTPVPETSSSTIMPLK